MKAVEQAVEKIDKVLADGRKQHALGSKPTPVNLAVSQAEKMELARLLDQERILRNAVMLGEGQREYANAWRSG